MKDFARDWLVGIAGLALVTFVVLAMSPGAKQDWEAVQAQVERSSARLESWDAEGQGPGICTTFSIDEERGHWLTAAHCINATIKVDGHIAWLAYTSPTHDLAVMVVPGVRKPALRPSTRVMTKGQAAGAYGYGYGWKVPQFRVGLIGVVGQKLDEINSGAPPTAYVFGFDQGFIGGMSGGSVVDQYGEVIGIVQMGDAGSAMGLGRDISVVLGATGQFWE